MFKEKFANLRNLFRAKKRAKNTPQDPAKSNLPGPISQDLYHKMDPSWEARRKEQGLG